MLQRVVKLRSIPVFDFFYSLHILLLHRRAQVVCEWSRHDKLLWLILGRRLNFFGMYYIL